MNNNSGDYIAKTLSQTTFNWIINIILVDTFIKKNRKCQVLLVLGRAFIHASRFIFRAFFEEKKA